jgi:hypothetical protein
VNGFIDNLCTPLGTASTYNAIADLHALQITTAHAKSSQSAFTSCFQVTDLNNGDSSASVLMSLLSGEYPTTALHLIVALSLLSLPCRTQLNWHLTGSESESYVTTDGQPASLSWNKAPFWRSRPDIYYDLTVAGSLEWGALSDESTGLSFTIAAGPRQRSHFRIRVP